MTPRSLKPFTPTREDAASLDRRTVGREPLIDKIVARLVDAATSSSRTHTLLIGPRGAGKTHMVEVVLHRVAQSSESSKLLVLRLAEDSVGLTSYADLLVELVGRADRDLVEPARVLRSARDISGLESLLVEIADGRVIVLAVENLHRIFDAIGREGQRSLRAWVETGRQLLLLATAPLLLEPVSDRDAPWFGSFTSEFLDDLSVEEGQRLLVELHRDDEELATYLASDEAHHRLEALAHLAGGSPRLWIIAAMCITVESLDELVPAVEDLLEKLVPYYQERLWELSGLTRS